MATRQEAITAIERRCPRCGAARDPGQAYCIDCGLRLPPTRGGIARLRRGWVRRFGWYPGDWIWFALVTLFVAAAGAAIAIRYGDTTSSTGAGTVVAPRPRAAPATAAQLPSAPEPGTKKRRSPNSQPAPPGQTAWPAGRSGWTIVLFSYPATGGTAAPAATAARAARAGLPEVGMLQSGGFSSLHPGYYIVFSGVYSSADEAAAALRTVRASGFSTAYTRHISR